jgi:hypothetical protein
VFLDPHDLDPSKHAAKVTREVAGYLANLAKKLEADGHPQDLVATFLMRCLFTMSRSTRELRARRGPALAIGEVRGKVEQPPTSNERPGPLS